MDNKKLAEKISDLLPDGSMYTPDVQGREEAVAKTAKAIQAEKTASELARVKLREKARLRSLEKAQAKAEELGLDPENVRGATAHQVENLELQRQRVEAIEAIELENTALNPVELAAKVGSSRSPSVGEAIALQGASRAEMARLLTSLNINLSVQLSKTDTANLLACLLTCNESQLLALQRNKKVPVVIKAIITRLLKDMNEGTIGTIERIWDRVFGKGAMQLTPPDTTTQIMQGLIPNTPISREAYVVIRDTIIK